MVGGVICFFALIKHRRHQNALVLTGFAQMPLLNHTILLQYYLAPRAPVPLRPLVFLASCRCCSSSQPGLLFFLFLVGMELDPLSVRRSRLRAFAIAADGISTGHIRVQRRHRLRAPRQDRSSVTRWCHGGCCCAARRLWWHGCWS